MQCIIPGAGLLAQPAQQVHGAGFHIRRLLLPRQRQHLGNLGVGLGPLLLAEQGFRQHQAGFEESAVFTRGNFKIAAGTLRLIQSRHAHGECPDGRRRVNRLAAGFGGKVFHAAPNQQHEQHGGQPA